MEAIQQRSRGTHHIVEESQTDGSANMEATQQRPNGTYDIVEECQTA